MPKEYTYLHAEVWFKLDANIVTDNPLDGIPLYLPLIVRFVTLRFPGWMFVPPSRILHPCWWQFTFIEN